MIKLETASIGEMEINHGEILRYLGYGKEKADEKVLLIIEKCLAEMTPALSFKACFGKFSLKENQNGDLLFASIQTDSKSLKKNLENCNEVIIFTATIGVGADRIIGKYNMISPTYAVISQAIGAMFIEAWCDVLCNRFEKYEGKFLRPRFSAGYGDFPLDAQKEIFKVLDCPRKIGVSLTEGLLMVPSKSVSAIIGVGSKDILCHKSECEICSKENCEFKRS